MLRLACAAGLWLSAAYAAAPEDSHRAPVRNLASEPRAVEKERQGTLAELWQRRILPPDTDQFSPEDLALLARLRGAESSGALAFLRERLHGLKGLAVSYKPAGSASPRWRLTKEGFDRYLFLRSQDAIQYFEAKGVDAKWAFQLRDLDDSRLFEPGGLLTLAGETVYARAAAGLEAHWKTPAGDILGNRRPPPRYRPPAPPQASAIAAPPGVAVSTGAPPAPPARPSPEPEGPDGPEGPPPRP